jgi:hypothetical protein
MLRVLRVNKDNKNTETNRFVRCESDGSEVDHMNDDYDDDDGSDEV